MWRDPDTEELLIRKLEAISDFGMLLSQLDDCEYEEGTAVYEASPVADHQRTDEGRRMGERLGLELNIIGLVGYAQTGKDEAAKALSELGWRRVSFADPVRNGLYALNPYIIWWDQHSGKKQTARLQVIVDAIGWEGAKKILEVRELLQRYGTDAGRLIHGENCWVNIAMTYAEGKPLAIFTDVRFPNEAAAIRDRGGLLVRVERPGVGPVNGHVSDTGVADIECHETWVNDSDLRTWQKTVLDKYGWWVGQEKLSENLKNLVASGTKVAI